MEDVSAFGRTMIQTDPSEAVRMCQLCTTREISPLGVRLLLQKYLLESAVCVCVRALTCARVCLWNIYGCGLVLAVVCQPVLDRGYGRYQYRDHMFINICLVPRKLFVHEADRPSVQTSPEGFGKC